MTLESIIKFVIVGSSMEFDLGSDRVESARTNFNQKKLENYILEKTNFRHLVPCKWKTFLQTLIQIKHKYFKVGDNN